MLIVRSSIVILCIILLATPVYATSRQDSILDFVDNTRISSSGFANTIGGEISLEPTVDAMEIKQILNSNINNSLDILYYFQRLQNASGGFAPSENSPVELSATINAIRGLRFLDVNQSQYIHWSIFPFLNSTVQSKLITVNNNSLDIQPLTYERLTLWYDFIVSSTQLGMVPTIPALKLIDMTKSLQYPNGSYYNFNIAIASVNLLNVLGEAPNDPDLAKKFILSFMQDAGAFSSTYNGDPTIYATYQAVRSLSKLVKIDTLDISTDIVKFILNYQKSRSGFARVGSTTPSINDTHHAVLTLSIINSLSELQSPDVLQEVGFVHFNQISLIFLLLIPKLRRKLL